MKSKVVAALAVVGLLVVAQALSVQAQDEKKDKKRGGPFGTVKSIDATAKTITVAIRERGKKETTDKTFKLADDCKVTQGDDAKTLSDVKEGQLVGLTVTDDKVTQIRLVMRKKKDNA